jgi:hypothetical protein
VDSRETLRGERSSVQLPPTTIHQERGARRVAASSNFGVKLARPGFGPVAELPRQALFQLLAGSRRAASASGRGTGRAAYTAIC